MTKLELINAKKCNGTTGVVKFKRGELVLFGNSIYVYKHRDIEVIGHVDD